MIFSYFRKYRNLRIFRISPTFGIRILTEKWMLFRIEVSFDFNSPTLLRDIRKKKKRKNTKKNPLNVSLFVTHRTRWSTHKIISNGKGENERTRLTNNLAQHTARERDAVESSIHIQKTWGGRFRPIFSFDDGWTEREGPAVFRHGVVIYSRGVQTSGKRVARFRYF